jgi:UDP-N-acetylglucosamine--N-acetylmuramyl-(pentapeptide) pyrophosphoryl-undecaprenol N-acetylglucosamine transferase
MSVLLVCSGGGHLKQLHTLLPRMPFPHEDRLWVTFDTGLSRSLLAGENVVYATYAAPRDAKNIARNAALALRLVSARRFDHAVSTGSSLAVNFLPLAHIRGARCQFIETAARATGPSMTGRIVRRLPGIHTYTQYPVWADSIWRFAGSVFDDYSPGPARSLPEGIKRAVVTVGTTESYGFRRLIEALIPLVSGIDVLWQTGVTDVSGLGITGRSAVPHTELVEALGASDLVVAHAGTGAAITALEMGICPLLVPRLRQYGEHVDDHQVEIASELARRGLAVRADVANLRDDTLRAAASRSVVRSPSRSPLLLSV